MIASTFLHGIVRMCSSGFFLLGAGLGMHCLESGARFCTFEITR